MLKALASPALLISLLFSCVCGAMADNVPRNVVTELAPTGKLRVAINFGNIVLAQQDPASGEPRGVSAELARELAKRLAVPIEFLTFDAAGKVFDALGKWEIAFLAIDPVRAAGIDFTPPYVIIEGAYVVPADSALKSVEDVDRDGVRVAVARASAYDLYLARAQARQAGAGIERTGSARDVPQGSARSRGRGEAADRGIRQRAPRHARDPRSLYGDRAGHGHAQGPRGRCALSARIHRGDEGFGLRRQGAQRQRPDRCRGRAPVSGEMTSNSAGLTFRFGLSSPLWPLDFA